MAMVIAMLRPLAVLTVLTILAALATACTGHSDETPTPRDTATGVLGVGGDLPDAESTASAARSSSLALALSAVPPSVLYASFTDVAAVRRDLGYATVDSASSASQRFAFWEDARAAGTMLTGRRLYDDVSAMEDNFGWTADDVTWEIDFSGNETGCTRDMLCDPSGGSVLALRSGISGHTIVQSLAANGFTLESGGHLWSTDRVDVPFAQAVYLPELNAVALGNAIGLVRVSDVAEGAPSFLDQIPTLASQLGSPLSAYIDTTGCVSAGEALGPDATDADLHDLAKRAHLDQLATAAMWTVTIDSATTATSLLDLTSDDGAVVPDDETAMRNAVLQTWTSVQTGLDFEDVASGAVSVDGSIERVAYDVQAMPAFAAMVLTHDAPWALCSTSGAP